MNRQGTASTKELVVGRSRQCDMVLDYRWDDHYGKLMCILVGDATVRVARRVLTDQKKSAQRPKTQITCLKCRRF